MDPDYEERRPPRSLADMLGLRDHDQEEVVTLDTGTRGIGSIVTPPHQLGAGAAVEAIDSADSSRWDMPRRRYLGGCLVDVPSRNGCLSARSSGSGSSSAPRRPSAPQQHLRYTSLLEVPDQPYHRPRSAEVNGFSHGRIGVDELEGEERYESQEDQLPTYEEAIAQPPSTRVSIPLIAEAERQVPTPIRHDRHYNHNTHRPQSSPPPPTSAIPTPNTIQSVNPSSSVTALDTPSTSLSHSRLHRLLRRRQSSDHVRPPPPQEGVPLELLCDKFGNRRRDILWSADSSGKVWRLGNLGNGGHGLLPILGSAGRSIMWERRLLRRGGRERCG